jgi:hypothetical protein
MAQITICDVSISHSEPRPAHFIVKAGAQTTKDVCIDCVGEYISREIGRIGKDRCEVDVWHVDYSWPQATTS